MVRRPTRLPNRQIIRQRATPRSGRPRGRGLGVRLIIGLVVAGFAIFSYLSSSQFNEITGEEQYVNITADQEIALGLQAAPQMISEYGGLDPDGEAQAVLDAVGLRLVENSIVRQTPYQYEFYLLADSETVNAFALPGGQVFITAALFDQLQTEGQLAGVIGHEIGHVVARHGAQRIAQQQLTQGLTGAVVMATYDPENPATQRTAQVAMVIGQLVTMKYGREDELQSDILGVRIMAEAGYDPRSMIQVMEILAAAGGGGRQPEFFSTHPNPDNRIENIEAAIREVFPDGVPAGLQP